MRLPSRFEVRAAAEEMRAGRRDAHEELARALAAHDVDGAAATVLAMSEAALEPEAALVRRLLPLVDDSSVMAALAASVRTGRHAMLLDAVEEDGLTHERKALALLLVALGEAKDDRERLATLLRKQARQMQSSVTAATLQAAANALGDPHVLTVVQEALPDGFHAEALVRGVSDAMRAILAAPVGAVLPDERGMSGHTVRRGAPKVGRNDPCPCGSGKKWKRCCEGKESLPTSAQLLRESAKSLTGAQVFRLSHRELLELPLAAVADEALLAAAVCALDVVEWELAERALDELELRVGHAPTRKVRERLVDIALERGALAVAKRGVARLAEGGEIHKRWPLLLALHEPNASTLIQLDQSLRGALPEDPERLSIDVAHALLDKYPALGIFFARGALSPKHGLDSAVLLDAIERARDELGLAPGDPSADAFDALVGLEVEARAAQKEAAGAVAEVRELRARLQRAAEQGEALERRLAEQEKRLAAHKAPPPPVASRAASAPSPEAEADEAERRRLRTKLDELKALVTAGNRERSELRLALEESRARLPTPEVGRGADDGASAEPLERELADAPARRLAIPVFAKAASAALRELPERVARDALALVGELAGGAANAWREVKQLERVTPPLLSARLGIHYRVLFRLEDGELRVLELTHRRGLEGAIRRYV